MKPKPASPSSRNNNHRRPTPEPAVEPSPEAAPEVASGEPTVENGANGTPVEVQDSRGRPLTVIVSHKEYSQARTLAALEGVTLSSLVSNYFREVVPARLKVALARAAEDLG